MQQPLTTKELEYISDSMRNEDLLTKQCAAVAATVQNQQAQQVCMDLVNRHQQHYQILMQSLQQHINMAPNMPQQ